MKFVGSFVLMTLILAFACSARAQDEPEASAGWEEHAWVLDVGGAMMVEGNSGGARVNLYGVGLGLSHWLTPAFGVSVDYRALMGSRGGLTDVHTLQLHHYFAGRVHARALISRVAAVGGSLGPAMVVEQHAHQSPTNSVWAHVVRPVLHLGINLDATTETFGVRLYFESFLGADSFDAGAGAQVLVPL